MKNRTRSGWQRRASSLLGVGYAGLALVLVAGCGAEAPLGGDSPVDEAAGVNDAEFLNEQGASLEGGNASAESHTETSAVAEQQADQKRIDLIVAALGEEQASPFLSTPAEAKLIHELDVQGAKLRFIEPSVGHAAIVVIGDENSSFDPSPGEGAATAADVYRAFAPDSDVPTALLQLDQRALEMAPIYEQLAQLRREHPELIAGAEPDVASVEEAPEQIEQLSGDGVATLGEALTSSQCLDGASWCDHPLFHWKTIQSNKTSTPPRIYREDAEMVKGIGCALAGQVRYRVRYLPTFFWTEWFSYDLVAGQWVGAWWLQLDFDEFEFEAKLSNFVNGGKATQCAGGRDWP